MSPLSQCVCVLSSFYGVLLSVCHNPRLDDEFVLLECFMSWFLDFAKNSSSVDYLMFSRMWDRVPTIFLIRIGLTFLAMQFANCSSSRHGNKTQTHGYPPEPAPKLTGKTRFDWV